MPTDQQPIPAIGYIRVSTAREEMISPEIQRAAVQDWARRNGREIIEPWVEDLDVSGRTFKRRVIDAIDRVKAGEAREIIVWKFSRFGRNRLGWAVHLDQVEAAGGSLQSATEEVDARTAAGRFTRGMLAEVAAFESDRIGESWVEAHENRRRRGLPAHGTPRFGYVRRGRVPVAGEPGRYVSDPADGRPERYEPDPELAPVLVGLYRRYVAGEGSMPLVRWLNLHGYRTARGREWTVHTLFTVLDSGFAAGLLRIHNKDCACKRRSTCRNVTYIPGAQVPLIGPGTDHPDLWDAYVAHRGRMRVYPPRSRRPVYPLSGLMQCGSCRYGMSISNGRGQPGYAYRCTRWKQVRDCDGSYVRRTVAEQEVLRQLGNAAAEIEAAAAARPELPPAAVAPPARERLEAEQSRIDRALARLARMRALDDDDSPAAEQEFRAARDDLRAQRRRVGEQLAGLEEDPPEPVEHLPVIRVLLADWDLLPVAARRDLLAQVVRRVVVHRTPGSAPPVVRAVMVWEEQE